MKVIDELSLCKSCFCATKTVKDQDRNTFCGKCKAVKEAKE